jgi:hypothetical protein
MASTHRILFKDTYLRASSAECRFGLIMKDKPSIEREAVATSLPQV